MYLTTTFSIIGYDKENNELGVGVQSKFLSVGSLVPYVESGVCAIASQAKTNSTFGKKGAELIKKGLNAQEALTSLLKNDRDKDIRQVGIIDKDGNMAAYTGKKCYPFAGYKIGKNCICQGNVLLGPIVLEEMAKAFENTKGDLAEKIVSALEAAQNAGGEKRGQESAALLVKKVTTSELLGESDVLVDIRVDEHISPIMELKRLLQRHRIEYASNYSDKFILFEGDTKYLLIELLLKTKIISRNLKENESIKDILINLGNKLKITPIFTENYINGKIVEWIVNQYYILQEKEYNK